MRERQEFAREIAIILGLAPDVLHLKSSSLVFGMNLANKVTPSHGGIGL